MRRAPLLGVTFLLFAAVSLVLVFGLSDAHLVAPPLSLEKPDFADFEDSQARKQAFFEFLTPMIVDQNNRVLETRERLLSIADELEHTGRFSDRSAFYIEELVRQYRFDDEALSTEQQLQRLLRRVDMIPVPLALAQAASESGWGNSRFARNGNNFFGQWCYVTDCGAVPNKRKSGATHEVATFDSVRESITSYFFNINTHYAYKEFRDVRQQLRERGKTPRTMDLLPTLLHYSERREEYLEDLVQIIRVNNLSRFEQDE